MTKKIIVTTKVTLPLDTVIKKFDRTLFESLMPPLSLLELLQYDGTFEGGRYRLGARYLNFSLWEGEITKADFLSPKEYVFIDEVNSNIAGVRNWKHTHRFVESVTKHTYIVDEVEFEAVNPMLEGVYEMMLRSYFLYRQFRYKKLLNKS
jgi:ligand-binding SRPBCC domain-containing protein